MGRKGPRWLRDAVFYQIYPQSFYDSNGDGIGDIEGIIRKLDYIESLGANALWINPCFVSPFGDAGYDVSDYYKVDPRYGTNADLRRLFREAHAKGIRVCLDLVPGHTSTEHPWFKAACAAKRNKYSDWYVWTDSVWSWGGGMPTINGYSQRDGNYITNFFWFQPALNYGFAKRDPRRPWKLPVGHPAAMAVRREMRNVMRFWLDMGADGFRVDMAFSLIKEDPGHRETKKLWRGMRRMFDREYPEAILISEWSHASKAIPAGFHVDFMVQFGRSGYTSLFRKELGRCQNPPAGGDSFFSPNGKGNIREFMDIYLEEYRRTKRLGYISIPSGNHDVARLSVGKGMRDLELAFAFVMTMPGTPFIYYGDEIGMRYMKNLPSKEGGYYRTGARTPMQWTRGRNAGFSSARSADLYLPVDKRPGRPAVESQEKSSGSLLNKVRSLVALRHRTPALGADGDFLPLFAQARKYPLVYLRKSAGGKVLVAINPSARPAAATFSAKGLKLPGETLASKGKVLIRPKGSKAKIEMGGVSYGIFAV